LKIKKSATQVSGDPLSYSNKNDTGFQDSTITTWHHKLCQYVENKKISNPSIRRSAVIFK